MIVDGSGIYHLDGEDVPIDAGDVVFVPAGAVHGTRNTGTTALHLHAVFPARRVVMEMLQRNPAPGTEDAPPSTTRYDFATGTFETISGGADAAPSEGVIATPPS